MTGDLYVQSVIDHVPRELPLRDQIAMELRGHIAERVERGQPLGEVLQQLGDPLTLAESYLAAVPFEIAGLLPRLAAKLIDAATVAAVAVTIGVTLGAVLPMEASYLVPLLCISGAIVAFVAYTVIAEYRAGWTLGKRLMGIRVVRESGARISLGQSLLRQIPFIGQFFFIDALFALFTERHQRAFELLTKTRAIALLICIGMLTTTVSAAHANAVDAGARFRLLVDIGRPSLR
jgi:uncharacterized RDD family membrane protein YckC